MRHLAATKCNRASTMTDDAIHALRMATQRAESSGRRYGVFSCGKGRFRVRRITGSPTGALEIVTPSWNYLKTYREALA